MENKYFYDDRYYTLEEIVEMYQKLHEGQKKPFRDCLAHFTLLEILKKSDYDEDFINILSDIVELEAAKIKLYGSDCGRPLLFYEGQYKRNLRKLINLTGKLANIEDSRMNKFNNGEWLLNNLVCLTIGSSFEKDIVGDLVLINCDSLSEDECLAIADNFVRDMKDEKIVFYNRLSRSK